ncbi:hypothetical protein DB346_00430 [Verrucomicrobia bacterium LW23]|nr:hypothetical protein DB346_00430 [Verrucomicrobia bacterium LW23]
MGEKGACFVRHGQVPGEAEDAARPDGTLTEPGGALRHSESALSCEALLAVPPRVRVLSTVGAGDAMVAGWLSSRLCDLSPEDTARRATAFSLDVLTHGHSGLSSADVVAEFAASVCVRPAGSAASIELPAV